MVSKLENITTPTLSDSISRNDLKKTEEINMPAGSMTTPSELSNIPQPLEKEFKRIYQEVINREIGSVSLSKRLAELTWRVNDVIDGHVCNKRNEQFSNREDTKEIVEKQKKKRFEESFVHGFGGGVAFVLPLAAALSPEPFKSLFTSLSQISQPGIQAVVTALEGQINPLSYQQNLSQHDLQVVQQLIDRFEQIPEKLQNHILEILRLEQRIQEEIFQK